MSALTDALQAVIDAKYNAVNLADPDLAYANAVEAWMHAVTDAITTGTGAVMTSVSAAGEVSTNAVDVATLQAQEEDLAAKVAAGQAALQALEATLHPADAAPSSTEPPTIAPKTPGASR